MFSYGDRIRMLRMRLGLSQSEFAQKLGIHKQMVSDVERGKQKSFNPQVEERLIKIFSINPQWLREGRGEMFIGEEKIFEDKDTTEHLVDNCKEGVVERLSEEEAVLLRYFRQIPSAKRLETLACVLQCLAQHSDT